MKPSKKKKQAVNTVFRHPPAPEMWLRSLEKDLDGDDVRGDSRFNLRYKEYAAPLTNRFPKTGSP